MKEETKLSSRIQIGVLLAMPALICILATAGCVGTQRFYTGSSRPRADLAVVKVVRPECGFLRVDGSSQLPSGKELAYDKSIELLIESTLEKSRR